MIPIRQLPIVLKYIIRHRVRSLLTVTGIGLAMFLFCAVQAMRTGVAAATQEAAGDTTLVVYRENRFCPFTSQLPQDYSRTIAAIPGVASVIPMKILVNNCRASLDVITYRGVPEETFEKELVDVTLIAGSREEWASRSDAALVGERLAQRRGLKIGDQFTASGITAYVAGIISSVNPQDENVAYVHLGFLQRTGGRSKEGIVTQFNVRVDDPDRLDAVAAAIDAEFKAAQDPTWTSSEKAFVARAVSDIVELVSFAGWLGIGSLFAIFGLVANGISLSVQDRIKDHAVMQTLGYSEGSIARLIVTESLAISLLGGVLGVAAAGVISNVGQYSFSVDGMSIAMHADYRTIAAGVILCALIGIAAGLMPAFRAARLSTAEAFRSV